MLRNVDGWEGEHFSFDATTATANAAPTAGPTHVTIDHGADGPSATIPDSHLLFTAQFSRAGADLVLTGDDGKAFVVEDYFANDARARLLSAEGAALSPDVVAALAGPLAPGQYAQAGAAQPSVKAVGRVVQADGDATIVRNGVAMAAHAGDAILKGDVLQTVTGTFGVTFNDGSTLNLTANSRLVVNEFVYDPKGSANSQLLDLVQGSLTFISGEVAHNGDMKIGTPVATMAIRGTVGGVTTANDGTVNFYVSQSATGAVILDSRGTVIANVVQDGPLIIVRPVGPLQVLAEEVQKSPAQLATELAALQQIVSIQSVGQQIIQQFFQQDPNANPNPQSTDKPHTQFQIDLHTNNPTGPNGDQGPNDGNPTPPVSATVTQTTTDGDGNKTTKIEDIKLPANLAPVTFGPLQQAVNEDTALVFSNAHGNAISVFDADTASLTVTVAATHGVVSLSGVAGLTFTSGDGSGDATMTFSGTQAAINAALDGMSFTPAAEYSGQASVSVTTSDGNSTGATDTIAITVAAVNDAPVLDHFNLAVAEGGTTVLLSSDFHITDPDSSSFFFTVANVTGGQFEVFTNGHWVAAPTGGFTADDIAASHVRFVHDGGEAAPSFSVWASDGTDAGAAISPTVSFTNVNDAPVATPISITVTEDNAPVTVDGLAAASDPDAGDVLHIDPLTVTLSSSDGHGHALPHPVTYSVNGSQITIDPAQFDYLGAGKEAVLQASYDVVDGSGARVHTGATVTVNGVNDAPVIATDDAGGPDISVAENTTAVTIVTASDADAGTTLLYSIAGGADSALFDINSSTGVLTFKTAPDYEAPADQGADNIYNVTVQASDGALTDIKNIAVHVTDVDETPPAPVPQPSSATVSEEGLSRGIADTTGDTDTTNSATATGAIAVTGGGNSLSFTLGQPQTDLTYNGTEISWAGAGTASLTGNAGTIPVVTISIDAHGHYEVALIRPIDHPDGSAEDVTSFDVPVTVSNDQQSASTTLTVGIEDDSPNAAAYSVAVKAGPPTVNVVIILDISGSMNTPVSGELTRLDLAKAAIQHLLETTAVTINQVMAVSFGTNATVNHDANTAVWTSAAVADSFIQTLTTNGNTYYDHAISAVATNWGVGPTAADKTLVYFITDGDPTSGHGADTGTWEALMSSHGVDASYAVGIGASTTAALTPIAWTSVDANAAPVILDDPAGLDTTLQATIPEVPTHNIFAAASVGFGADGGYIASVSVNGVTYDFDGQNTIHANDQSGDRSGTSIDVSTALGGTFTFYFAATEGHAAGDWIYTPPAQMTAPAQETFHYVLTDNDGDTSGADLTVSVTAANYAPVVDLDSTQPGLGFEATASAHDTPVAVFGDHASIADADSANLQSALVSFQGDYVHDDLYVDGTGLAGATIEYNGHAGTYAGLTWHYSGGGSGIELTITGDASVATYTELLDAVRFSTHSGDLTDREVSVTVNDGVNDSAAATATIHLESLIHWTSALGGDWYFPDNWTSGPYVPGTEGSADDVSILLPIDHTVSLADYVEIGNLTVGAGVTLDVTNDPDVSSGSLYVYGGVSGAGQIVASDGGYVYFDSHVESNGQFLIAGGKMEFAAGVKDGLVVSFDIDTSDILQLDSPSLFASMMTISDFGFGDKIVVPGGFDFNFYNFQEFSSFGFFHYQQGGVDSWIWVDGHYTADNFAAHTDEGGNTTVSFVPTIWWDSPTGDDNIAFSLNHVSGSAVSVDWGDGSDPTADTNAVSHGFAAGTEGPAQYQMTVGLGDGPSAVSTIYNVIAADASKFVFGTSGNDVLIGHSAAGLQIFDSGAGGDAMFASDAADTFVFSPGYGRDTVVGFNTAEDFIDISGFGLRQDQLATFMTQADDHGQGLIFYQGDTTLFLQDVHAIQASNFILSHAPA